MSSLEQLHISPTIDATHYLWLNENHQVTAQSETANPAEAANLIVIHVNNSEDWQSNPPALATEIPDDVHLLDVLTIHHERWRSLLCTDHTCCPPDGISIVTTPDDAPKPLRTAMFTQWQTWLLTHHIPDHLLETALDTLRDLPLRDALLAQLAHDPAAIQQWRRLGDRFTTVNHPAWLSIMSSVHFLEENLAESRQLALRALEIEPEYSLARLLIQALEADAPKGIVLSAFSRYTSQELLNRAQFDLAPTPEIHDS
jgi:hypothetical protein